MNYIIKRIGILGILFIVFLTLTTYGELAVTETPTIFIQNRFTTNDLEGKVNLSTNISEGIFYLVHRDYLSRITSPLSTTVFEIATSREPAEATFQNFSSENTFHEVSTRDLKVGEYTVFIVDQFDNIVLQSELFVVISDSTLANEFKMKSIQVNSQDIENFDPNQFYYEVEFPESKIPTNNEELMALITGETMDPEAFLGKFSGEEPNTVLLRPYINFEFSPVPYTIAFVSTDSSSGSSSLTIPDRVRNFNSNLKAINSEVMTHGEIQSTALENLRKIKALILDVNDPKTAEKVYGLLSETMTIIGRLMPYFHDNNPVVKEIAGITDHSRKLAFLIDNATVNGDLTEKYFNSMHNIIIKIKSQEYETKNLKNKIYDLGNQAVRKTAQYRTPQDYIDISNDIGNLEFRLSDIIGHFALARFEFNKINNAMVNLLGKSDPRNIKPHLSLDIDKPENIDVIHAKIDKDILDKALEEGYTQLTLNSGEAGVEFANDILSDSEKALFIRTEFTSNHGIKHTYDKIPIKGGKIADITMESDTSPKTKFSLPIELEFELSQWELNSYTDEALNNLSFFVLNEHTNIWEVVGGNFDPVTQTIKVMRMSLSKYTVMQSQKGFSDLEHAWAKNEINELLGKGIIDENSTFSPDLPVSRKDFTVWVSNAYGLKKEDLAMPFEDVFESDPYFVEISTAYNLGVINGKSATSFDPEGKITREEISTIVSNALSKFDDKSYNPQLVENLHKYSDFHEISIWAQNTVSLVDELGIMRGDDISFRPKDNVTRQEAASIIKRIYN